MAKQQERAANAERSLLELRGRLAPRVLNAQQLTELTLVASNFSEQVLEVTRYTLSKEAQELSAQIESALAAGGWKVAVTGYMGGSEYKDGVILVVEKGQNSVAADTIKNVLNAMGIAVKFTASDGFRPTPIPPGTVLLFVGAKPDSP